MCVCEHELACPPYILTYIRKHRHTFDSVEETGCGVRHKSAFEAKAVPATCNLMRFF
jgi:hypothetical protein